MKHLLTSIAIISLLIHGCKKPGEPNIPINTAMYNAYAFKTGTYWIYQDSISGAIDSFCVISATLNNSPQNGYIIQGYLMDINTYKLDSFESVYQMSLGDSFLELALGNFDSQFEQNLDYDFIYPIRLGQFISGSPNDTALVNNIYNSYSVNGQTYSNVAQVHHYSSVFARQITQHDDWFYLWASLKTVYFSQKQSMLNFVLC